MAVSIALIILLGLLANLIFTKLKLPGLLGMLILGIIAGPYVLDIISDELLRVSEDFRQIALIIILLRAGLGISRNDLNKVGKAAIKLSFIPGVLEGFAIIFLAMKIFGFTFAQAGIMGFIIAAVSPAVVVPQMLKFSENKIGTKKSIPTLILAGASLDDIFAITVFSTFLGLYSGNQMNIGVRILNIPISIVLGISIGALVGFILVLLFKKHHMRDTRKVLVILGVAILLTALEDLLKDKIEIAGLLAVMAIGFIILERLSKVAKRLALKFNKIWIFAEILLFVLIGAQVNIHVAFDSGLKGLLIIALGVIARSIGVIISTHNTNLNLKERLFCVISYTPKATVQAAIGAVPLSLGVLDADIILAVSVLSIIVTAPLGAIGINFSAKRLLEKEL